MRGPVSRSLSHLGLLASCGWHCPGGRAGHDPAYLVFPTVLPWLGGLQPLRLSGACHPRKASSPTSPASPPSQSPSVEDSLVTLWWPELDQSLRFLELSPLTERGGRLQGGVVSGSGGLPAVGWRTDRQQLGAG